ncbi:helix-turn-helix transcriptional regulator [Solirubrobacter sp. CPCC 204708]|uniref:TetR/AcrR family transcriptional regulator n=1 Tax=Solirubrobacter deserti TaxID=2282478 RepID=A0ABT4RG90_9ACTN|nr:TetR/AcrR family transcriptional regulator [Solirubrobacter deserti]MBE2319726.1 helix-turn-helix transcriptional regulator [Solirubrobacter deserti]MDA0137534.1 TetR/AcrR family transcriptional regulator [Solirubrobacter deserti]
MPRPRASIDTAALAAAFAADGLHGTPIDRVVAAAGVAKPTLYARGGDKEELFALAVEAEVERLIERFEGGVTQIAAALDDYVASEPGARLLFVSARLASGRVERSLRRISIALTAALGDEPTAAALLGATWSALHGGPPITRVARLLPTVEDAGPPSGIWTA